MKNDSRCFMNDWPDYGWEGVNMIDDLPLP